jgi:beta-lactamase regulating signal transducer with metallopeptidase domain/WD40 repeat protein
MNELDTVPTSMFTMTNVPFWEITLKSTIAIALAALACRLLQRQSAAMRHRMWVFGLAASLVVPMAALLLPQFTLAVLPSTREASTFATTQDLSPRSSIGAADSTLPDSTGGITVNGMSPPPELDTTSSTAISADTRLIARKPKEPSSPFARNLGIEPAFVFCWLLGTFISAILLFGSLVRQSIWLRRLRRIDDVDWVSSITAAARALGLERPIVALESDEMCVPAVVGVFSPRLVVSSNWRTWNLNQRQCILLHELAHIKRCDVATQLLGRLALLVYWFNPLVWHAVRQLRAERELASDDCVLLAGQTASEYAEQLLRTLQCCRPVRPAIGVAMAHAARLDQRVLAILDPLRRRDPVGSRFAIIVPCVVGAICCVLGGVTLTTPAASADPPAESVAVVPATIADRMWKENYTVEYPDTLPVSVAFSADGKMLLTGNTGGEVMALIFAGDEPQWQWKSKVEGSHAAVAFSADQKKVYATTEHGIRILDVARGKEEARIEVQDSNPTAIGVFPNKSIAEDFTRTQIVFGTPRGYFVKSWADGSLVDTLGTIETSTLAKDAKPGDEAAVPLAVDPNGRSAIMTGLIDATGAWGVKGKNVVWAYVCGDYEEGSPGNRVLVGHTATVVSAAWAKEGGTAVTGDTAGRVIVWDANTMQEASRLELGGRVAALAISDDGTRTAAYVLGNQGELYVWNTANPVNAMQPIHTELGNFSGSTAYASLSFSPDGQQLAGCAIDKTWLSNVGKLVGKVRVWQLSAEPKAQLPPQHVYSKQLPKGSSTNFVVLNNDSILMPASEEGAVDFRNVADGHLQVRLILGKFAIRGMRLSTDRRWLALEQHALTNNQGIGVPAGTFDVAVYDSVLQKGNATIPSCTRLLDVASGGSVVAVVRENQIELWDIATTKPRQTAPFKHTQIDTASFSPDGQLLAISRHNELVLWRWEDNTHERIELGRRVGSLAFSPDGRFLAEGPTPHENIQIRDMKTRNVVQTLASDTKLSMNVPRLAYSQGGRVLIACDNMTFANEVAMPRRISLWDVADGSLAHQLTLPKGLPQNFGVSPNGRYLVATLEDSDGVTLTGWRLDGENPVTEPGPTPPAAVAPN